MLAKVLQANALLWYCNCHNDFLSCAFRSIATKFTNLFFSEYKFIVYSDLNILMYFK